MHGDRATRFTIGGFRIVFDWSVLIVLALVAWSLASQVLPAGFPGHSTQAYWIAALAAAGAFLGSLVLHELSHAIAARRAAGVEVDDITFWLFGGVARIRGELPSPRLQLLVAGVGPLTSLALGVVLWGIALLLGELGAGGLIAGTVLWLGVMNGTLALFNLIPGSPLDGGRVLHAILWRLRGDRNRSAITAARVGQGVGAILIALGALAFLLGGNAGGLWTSLVGWFVLGAARAERQAAALRLTLGDRTVSDVMQPAPALGPAWFTVDAFLRRFAPEHRQTVFPVQEFDGRLSGVITLDDLRRVPPEGREAIRVSQLARPLERAVTVNPETSAVEVAARLAMSRQSIALVLDQARLVGIITPTDLERAIALGRGFSRGDRPAGPDGPVAPPTAPPPEQAPPVPWSQPGSGLPFQRGLGVPPRDRAPGGAPPESAPAGTRPPAEPVPGPRSPEG
jgi:Zn-dependent protease/CBS domain-containing protein